MDYKYWKLEVEAGVAKLTINRPETLNAVDIPTLLEMEEAVKTVIENDSIKVLVITGAGEKAFIAGGDIADLNSRHAIKHRYEFAAIIHRVFNLVADMEKPTIAAINGYALGGGTELLCCCDLRIASENARIGVPEINLGIFPGAGGSQRLPRQIPLCKAKELLFTGDMITAQEAERIGLINKVVPKEKFKETVDELAKKIAAKAPIALGLLKSVINRGLEAPLATGLALEREMISLALDTKDAHEGLSAFLEKRKPVFKGE
jgi:enoyl-CoA hydratase